MRVGIIGSGMAGQTLASGFARKGHDVRLGTRDPKISLAKTGLGTYGTAPLSQWASENGRIKVVTFADAAKHGEVVVFAVAGRVGLEALRLAGPENLAGKLVLDTSNPLNMGPNGIHKADSTRDSLLQDLQRAAPRANFVKAWNHVPAGTFVNPTFTEGPGDLLICGDNADAKTRATAILRDFGWSAIDVGDSSMGPYVEATGIALINYLAKNGDWGFGFKLIGRKGGTPPTLRPEAPPRRV